VHGAIGRTRPGVCRGFGKWGFGTNVSARSSCYSQPQP
jgi:hypothetical protein